MNPDDFNPFKAEESDPSCHSTPAAPVWEGAERPRVPPGEYTARCTGYQGPQWLKQFRRWQLRLEFVLDPNEEAVSAFYPMGDNPDASSVRPRSNYLKDWTRANGRRPMRGEPMKAEIFVNPDIAYTVRVRDVAKDSEGTVKDEALVYSRIDKIIEVRRLGA